MKIQKNLSKICGGSTDTSGALTIGTLGTCSLVGLFLLTANKSPAANYMFGAVIGAVTGFSCLRFYKEAVNIDNQIISGVESAFHYVQESYGAIRGINDTPS